MNILASETIGCQIRAAAVGPDGRALAIADGEGEIVLLDGSSLTRRDAVAIPAGLCGLPPATELLVCETQLAFLNATTLLVARVEHLSSPAEATEFEARFRTRLLALDVQTLGTVGEFASDGSVCRVAPLPIAPPHVLLSHDGLVLSCIDTDAWREVGRFGEPPEDHDPDSDIEEEIAPGGVAWDPRRGVVLVLWRYWNGGIVQTYTFEPARGRFTSVERAPVVSGTDAVLEAGGLCLSPDGSQIAAWFSIMDGVVPRDGTQASGVPRRARIGRLAVYSAGTTRFLDIESDVARDLCVMPGTVGGHDSNPKIRVGVDYDGFQPAYLDADHLLLNTPGGLLLNIDVRDGSTTTVGDFGTPLVSLHVDRRHRRIVTCGADGTVTLASL